MIYETFVSYKTIHTPTCSCGMHGTVSEWIFGPGKYLECMRGNNWKISEKNKSETGMKLGTI